MVKQQRLRRSQQQMTDIRPNLFIVGVAKAGTTNLHTRLASHPDIFMSTPKEPHHLAPIKAVPGGGLTLNRVEREDQYLRLFDGAEAPIVGESSTTNWWFPDTAARIDSFSPGAKAIVILRNPIDRIFSHYLNDFRDLAERRSFPETLAADRPGPKSLRWGDPLARIELGFYAERLRCYRETFDDRLLVIIFEEFVAEPSATLVEVQRFLELDPDASVTDADLSPSAINSHRLAKGAASRRALQSSAVRRVARRMLPAGVRARGYEALFQTAPRPRIDQDSARMLADLYAHDTAEVEAILDRQLPWTLTKSASKSSL
jgi:hypothetical protein